MTRGRLARVALVATLLAVGPRMLAAQAAGRDTLATPDTSRIDSVVPPSFVRLVPDEVPPGPLPAGSRLVFPRDSLLWTSAYTLADLLAEVPGVYVARTGFVGQPALTFSGGRGGHALEVFRDGVPVLPIGSDSVALDPGRVSLFGLGRVEIERVPGRLRVFLVTERNADVGSRSLVRVVSGDFKSGAYAGLFQQRWASGLGLDLMADHFDTEGDRDPQRNAQWSELGARATWTPSPTLAATLDIRRAGFVRDSTNHADGGTLPARDETRTEALVRVVASQRPERRGLALEAGVQSTSWSADSTSADTTLETRTVHRAFLGLGHRSQVATLEGRATIADHYTPTAATVTLGWIPLSGIVLAGDGSWDRHTGDRSSLRGRASLGLHRGAISLVGDLAYVDAVPAPMLEGDTAQVTLNLGARAGLSTRPLTVHAGLERRDGFAPPPLPSWPPFAALPATEASTYAVGDLTVRLGALALSGWVAHPVAGDTSAFEPPTHSRVTLTFRSKYWRTFRSGAFDLKAQIAVESWGAGIAGLDAQAAPVALPGATIAEAFLQIQLVQFRVFWGMRNALRSRDWYVPGFALFRTVQTFGVKWDFRN